MGRFEEWVQHRHQQGPSIAADRQFNVIIDNPCAGNTTFFEADFPATQADKRKRLRNILDTPPNWQGSMAWSG